MSGFSVLMAVHAGLRTPFLREALDSLATQTLPADEIVLVEDGPLTREMAGVLDEFASRLPLRRLPQPARIGLAACLNIGLAECRHELVARMDGDDICLPQRFALQVQRFAAQPELDVLGGYVEEIDEQGQPGRIRSVPLEHAEIFAMAWACPVFHPTVMYRRSRILGVGAYDPEHWRRQDYALWFECFAEGLCFANLPQPLIRYRFGRFTHLRQTPALAWKQAGIGYAGCQRLNLAYWKRWACYLPFLRALLPPRLRQAVYLWSARFDPRMRHARGGVRRDGSLD